MKKKIRSFAIKFMRVKEGDGSFLGEPKDWWHLVINIYSIFGLIYIIGAFVDWEAVSARLVATWIITLAMMYALIHGIGDVEHRKTGFYIWKAILSMTNIAWMVVTTLNKSFFFGESNELVVPITGFNVIYTIGAFMVMICMAILATTNQSTT